MLVLATSALAQEAGVHGLPFTRYYSFEEIGQVSRGARLGFDAIGRIAVIQSGTYMVLNDTSWVNLASGEPNTPVLQATATAPDGGIYYGALGAWGRLERLPSGRFHPRFAAPADQPGWAAVANFNQIVVIKTGVVFSSFNGAVYLEQATGRSRFFEVPSISRLFAAGDRVFAGSLTLGVQELDLATGTFGPVTGNELAELRVDRAVKFDETRALLSTFDGRCYLFDGRRLEPWGTARDRRESGRFTAMLPLVDGRFAIGIEGKGLFFVTPEGVTTYALTTPEYHRITDIAMRESGVLWVATENGVEKILYDSPLSVFGQKLGLPASWPQVANWQGHLVVASSGRLYESVRGAPGEPTRFDLIENPVSGVWGIAAQGPHLLIGDGRTVLSREADKSFKVLLRDFDAARLVMVGEGLCYAIGPAGIAALQWRGDRWEECAPRVPGVGYPSVVHATARAAWVELGANRVARLTLENGRIRIRVIDQYPWPGASWVNVGIVGDTVVLTGAESRRLFFDDVTEQFTQAPELAHLLSLSPRPIMRLKQDAAGVIWGSCDDGLVMIRRDSEGLATATFTSIDGRHPNLQLLPDGQVWLATGQALYHVDRPPVAGLPGRLKPVLASMTAGRAGRELFTDGRARGALQLPFAENSVVFQVFAGSYRWRQAPRYEFILHRGKTNWVAQGNGSLLTLPDLREGSYRLDVNLTGTENDENATVSVDFEIEAPWYRTNVAFACYGLLVAATVIGLMRLAAQRTRAHNLVLEEQVAERTAALKAAMAQLNEETRTNATVAERNRLAAEIHDSLQQGLSGLMLHLDSTLKSADLSADLRARLSVARNMVSFTRHEVQNAVWDMETPLLEDTELGDALKKLVALIGPGTAHVEVVVEGAPVTLSPAARHHLLRIAQESITNAVRHAEAATITVTLAYRADEVSLAISDDGKGFAPEVVLKDGLGHFGLRGLRWRAQKLGAKLHLVSAPGQGTRVAIAVRLPAPAYSHAE